MTDRRLVHGADLEVDVRGLGEPVLFVQTALSADELLPIAQQPVLADRYQTILYHRRGYAGSSSSSAPGSIVRDAEDAAALLEALGSSKLTLSASRSAARSPCSWPRLFPTACTASP